ncbi:MAG: 16S rRNA (cytosine(1402)-N(4))-methyltransferase RsmH [Candidatus Marinimicrobia bacterium]|nr:16S rRNA (cytosine(1402)-N(4))-methyltransferase RsmH [Candidatus Neomarinimicrobiota bacterium]
MSGQENGHIPVLVTEVTDWLLTDPHGIYVDGTLGGAGHSKALLNELASGATLLGIDADSKTLAIAEKELAEFPQNILLAEANFSHMAALLYKEDIDEVDGILLDLGLSSFQIDIPEKGFSYMKDGPLDMRFSHASTETAAKFINTAEEKDIAYVIKRYGEERYAKKIARSIIVHRPMSTTTELREAVAAVTPDSFLIKTLSRVFQALRIHVNRELDVLEQTLNSSLTLLKAGGRLAVISYHSLEDRVVKNFIKEAEQDCICPPELPQCVCDHEQVMQSLTKGIITPSEDEIRANPRARSAKLRVAERL